ncbi:MAG: AAA family ATPase [Thiohalomonadaceae bacterium]
MLTADLLQADRFLQLLDEEAETFTFQTFDDDKKRKDKRLARVIHGSLDDCAAELMELNQAGAGIFVTVNATDGTGRKNANIVRVRALWQEDDGQGIGLPVEPHMIVESSPGKFHRYILIDDQDGSAVREFGAVQARLTADYGSDRNAADLARVLRLPGFFHQKGAPFMARLVHESGELPITWARAKEIFPPVTHAPMLETSPVSGVPLVVDQKTARELRSALAFIRSDERDVWIRMGMALKELGDVGRGLWLEWSQTSEKYDPADAARTWASFQPTATGYRAIFAEAQRLGWPNPLTAAADPQQPATSTAPPADRFRLLSFADVASLPVEPSRIKGILPSRGVAALYGPSKSGKSFLSMHQAIHIVNGWEWFGYRTRPAPVVYCVLEGESGIPKRTRALESRFGKPERLRFIIEPWSLLNASDVEALIHVIKMTDAGNGVVYIDTLARAATGEENTSEYGAAVLDACQRIYSATGSLVILVAHTGKDAARGLRGHTSIFAGLDAAIEVTRGASGRSWSIAKAKDDEDETAHAFRLDVVNLGTDEDGDPITSCVVVPTEGAAAAVARPRPPSGGNQKIIWDALGELFKNSTHHGQGGAPETRAAIRLEEAITKTRTRLPCPSDRQTERARQALTGLISRGILAHQDGWIWCA